MSWARPPEILDCFIIGMEPFELGPWKRSIGGGIKHFSLSSLPGGVELFVLQAMLYGVKWPATMFCLTEMSGSILN
eukprot:1254591-Ditylum_brightwellii.AAC.1